MNRGRFLGAVALLLGLAAYVYFVELKGGEKKQLAKEESAKVLVFEPGDVTGITLTRGSDRVRLAKEEGAWKVVEPVSAASDQEAVKRLLESLQAMRRSHDLGKPADLAPFNLAAPPLSVELSVPGPGPLPPLALGDDAPTGGGIYARAGDDGKVLIVSGAEGARAATLFALRDKSFFKFDPSKLEGLVLRRSEDELALAKIEGKWGLLAPVRAPVEEATISDLTNALERLTVTEFVEEHPSPDSLSRRGLSPGRLRVKLHGAAWKLDPELRFGDSEGGGVYAVHPASGALVKITDSILPKLNSSVTDLRRKDLMPIQRWDLAQLRISGLTPQPLELRRKGDREWDRSSPSPGILADEKVDLLLRNLSDLKAEEFRDGASGRAASFGLDPPAARLEFWKQGEEDKPPSVLRVGKTEARKKIYFQDEKWPAIALADAALWQRAAEQVAKVAAEQPASPEAAQTAPATPGKPEKD